MWSRSVRFEFDRFVFDLSWLYKLVGDDFKVLFVRLRLVAREDWEVFDGFWFGLLPLQPELIYRVDSIGFF